MASRGPREQLGTWHDDTLTDIERSLQSYTNILEIVLARGNRHGSDLVVKRRDNGNCVRVEVQSQPWLPLPEAKGWARRHATADTIATILVCPEAHLVRAKQSVKKVNSVFGQDENVYFFDDKRIEQLAATIFALLKR